MTTYSDSMRARVNFIPEIRLRDKYALEAWTEAPLKPKCAIINYFQIPKKDRNPSALKTLRERLGNCDLLFLDAVDRDPLLDELDVEDYDKTARGLEVDAVITPDEYLYDVDIGHAAHDAHFSRGIRRAIDIVDLSKGCYSVVGLAVASDLIQFQEFVTALREERITHVALAIGDLLKRGPDRRHVLYELRRYLSYLDDSHLCSLLLGVSSHKIVRALAPDYWSNSEWSFEAIYGCARSADGTVKSPLEVETVNRMIRNLVENEQLKAD